MPRVLSLRAEAGSPLRERGDRQIEHLRVAVDFSGSSELAEFISRDRANVARAIAEEDESARNNGGTERFLDRFQRAEKSVDRAAGGASLFLVDSDCEKSSFLPTARGAERRSVCRPSSYIIIYLPEQLFLRRRAQCPVSTIDPHSGAV